MNARLVELRNERMGAALGDVRDAALVQDVRLEIVQTNMKVLRNVLQDTQGAHGQCLQWTHRTSCRYQECE